MIKRILTSKLQLGMYITAANNNWVPGHNSRQQGVLRSDLAIQQIQALGLTEVCIDTSKGLDSPAAVQVNPVGFEDEFPQAQQLHKHTKQLMQKVLADIKIGKAVALDEVTETADDMLQSLNNNPNTLLCLGRLRSKDEYLLEHSVNVATLLGLFCRHCGYTDVEQKEAICGGLLHDIGKIQVIDQVLHKPSQLTEDERVVMNQHVALGSSALNSISGMTPLIKSICDGHHEKLDGSGYPEGLSDEQISPIMRMSAICDIYDALTAERVYKEGMEPTKAMQVLVSMTGKHLDKELVYEFIRAMSVYPPGSLIELDDKHLGLVIEANLLQPDKPVIDKFYSLEKKQRIKKQRLNLTTEKLKIIRPVDAIDHNMNLSEIMRSA